MVLFQIPQTAIEQVTNIAQKLPAVPPEYLASILAFSGVFFLLSFIKFDLKLRIIAGVVLAAGLASLNLLPASISSKIPSFISTAIDSLQNFTNSLGSTGTLIASGGLILVGLVMGRLSGKFLFKKIVKKAGEPTSGMERKLKHLEGERDHVISQLKHAKGDPVAELKIEKKINKINEKINIIKAKLGLPITA